MADVDHNSPVYLIGIVQKLTGLTGRQIRYYEHQNLLQPERTKGNQRLYSPADVERLMQIKKLLAEGLTIEGVRSSLAGDSPGTPAAAEDPVYSPPDFPPEPAPGSTALPGLPPRTKLASLYPVNNQAALQQLLETRQAQRRRNE